MSLADANEPSENQMNYIVPESVFNDLLDVYWYKFGFNKVVLVGQMRE